MNGLQYIDRAHGWMNDERVLEDLEKAKKLFEDGDILEVEHLLLEIVDGIREFNAMMEVW